MGQKLRNFARTDHPLAVTLQQDMQAGRLVSDDIIEAMLKHYQNEHHEGAIIFDGIPRTFWQKALFDRVFPEYIVIYLDLNKETAIHRLSGRRVDPVTGASFPRDFEWDYSPYTGNKLEKRADDTPEAATKRIEEFYQNTLPLLAEWASEGKRVYRIDASLTPQEVMAHIEVVLSAYLG